SDVYEHSDDQTPMNVLDSDVYDFLRPQLAQGFEHEVRKDQGRKHGQEEPCGRKEIDERQYGANEPELPVVTFPKQAPLLWATVFDDGVHAQHTCKGECPPENGQQERQG